MNEREKKAVQMFDAAQYFIRGDDGLWMFYPSGEGGFSAWELVVVVKELKRRNKKWRDEMANDFSSENA